MSLQRHLLLLASISKISSDDIFCHIWRVQVANVLQVPREAWLMGLVPHADHTTPFLGCIAHWWMRIGIYSIMMVDNAYRTILDYERSGLWNRIGYMYILYVIRGRISEHD